MPDPIKKLPPNRRGQIRYRAVIDIGYEPQTDKATGEVITDPATGEPKMKRKQLTITKDTKTAVKDELARIRHQRSAGTYVAPAKMTVSALLDLWLKSATRDVEEATASNYDNALRPVRKYLGHKPVQELSEEDVEAFIDWMVSEGRQRGGKPGTGLGIRSVRLTLGRLRSALNLAVRRGLVVRNVAEYVTISKQAKEKAQKNAATHKPWNEEEVKRFLEGIQGHRSYAPMLLALIAERPAEGCGARWSPDVDLTAGTIAVGTNTRTIVYDRTQERGQRNKVVEKGAKTEAGKRTLPLPKPVLRALKAFRAAQAAEKLAAGEAYEDSGYVLVDDLGRPWKTDKLRREAHKLMATTGVRKVRLYDARHACLSWMANNGVPDTVVSAWAGHSDLGFTKRTYVHPDPQSLRAGSEKLAELLG
ncbi:tyrosine-type recombinase/integrase [Streptomyces sp. NPDC003656]